MSGCLFNRIGMEKRASKQINVRTLHLSHTIGKSAGEAFGDPSDH